jgi:hypothetical protein
MFYEPSLDPPVDEKLERISNYVDNFTLEDLAIEIHSLDLDESVKETIIELEIPNASDFMREVIQASNLDFLFKLVSKKTLSEIREILIDKLYWREE